MGLMYSCTSLSPFAETSSFRATGTTDGVLGAHTHCLPVLGIAVDLSGYGIISGASPRERDVARKKGLSCSITLLH